MLSSEKIAKIQKEVDFQGEQQRAKVFRALSDPKRLCVFVVLLKRQCLCLTDASRILDMSLPAISQHLKALEASGLVVKEREGKFTCYEVNRSNEMIPVLEKALL